METNSARLADLISSLEGKDGGEDSRATSPGPGAGQPMEEEEDKKDVSRTRPRTYPYDQHLPYEVESEVERQQNFNEILRYLYVAVEAGDFASGAAHWTRELRSWLGLKFDPSKDQRIRLVNLYYELALAPGVDMIAAERFSSMFQILLKSVHPFHKLPTILSPTYL